MANEEIRTALKTAKIPYWRIAEILGVCENTIVRRLRRELSENDKACFIKAINEIKKEKPSD